MSTPYDPNQYQPPGNQSAYDPGLSPYGNNPPSGSYPAQAPPTGSSSGYAGQRYGEPQYGQHDQQNQQPQYGQNNQQYAQPHYGQNDQQNQQPQYGYYQQQYGQPQYGQGFAGQPPQAPKSNKPWIIGGAVLAVLAIAATVLILVLNKKDDSAAGTDSGPTTSETSEKKNADDSQKLADAFDGSWMVVMTISTLEGGLNDSEGKSLGPGDNPNAVDPEWTVSAGSCKSADDCSISAMTDEGSVDLTLDGDKWVGDTTLKYWCDANKTSSSISDVNYEIEAKDKDTLKGTRTVSDNGECGEVFHEVDDLVLTKS